jgi:hypothetical protein
MKLGKKLRWNLPCTVVYVSSECSCDAAAAAAAADHGGDVIAGLSPLTVTCACLQVLSLS